MNAMRKLYRYIDKHSVMFITIILFLIPLFFWGRQYRVGGDDTRMYWVMPQPFFEQYSSSIITQNRLGTYGVYFSPAFLTPFYIFIWIISLIPFLNVQLFMYGANLAGGFLFFYLLLGLYIGYRNRISSISRIIPGLTYILSNFLINTLYSHELMSIFVVSVSPLLLYLFIRSVRENIYIFPIICALIYSIVSATLITLPWYGAFFFSVLPLLLFELKMHPKIFLKMFIIFLITFILLNFHWIIHIVASQMAQESGSSAISLGSIQGASRLTANYIAAISQLNSVLAQLFQQVRTGWFIPIIFSPLNAIYLLPILSGGIVFSSIKNHSIRSVYLISIFSFLSTVVLFTPNIDRWSLQLFLLLNEYIPLFPIFKTAYDKFASPLAFQYSFLLALSLYILEKRYKKITILMCVSVFILIFYSGSMYLFPRHNNEEFSTNISGMLNKDFVNMTSILREMKTGAHFVWLPFTFPSYIYIEDDKLPNHFYSGPSIITPLTNKIDYTGELSFDIPTRPGLFHTIIKGLKEKNYEAIGKLFQELGIRYIILNKQNLPSSAVDYQIWLWGSNKLDQLQTTDFITHMKGRIIATFGDRYELYEINPAYATDVLYLTTSLSEVQLHHNLTYVKDNESEYTVTINDTDESMYMVLLEPYYRTWRVYLEDKEGKYTVPYLPGMNTLVFGYANAWKIDTAQMRNMQGYEGGDKPLKLKIIFEPKRLQNIGNFISATGYIISVALVFYAWYVQKRKKNVN